MAEQNNQQKKGGQQQDANQLIQVRYDKLHELQANGKNPFEITKYDVTHHSTDIKDNFESLEGQEVTVAGRMMFKRVMGKASFCNVQDLKGRIQAYVARDEIGEESYADFKKYDVGDILGIKGKVFKTQTGEISIHAQEVTLLSKSLQILPEKYHGLTDTDARYRQRYVDLIMNEDVKDTFVKRSKVISSIRRYLDGQGFMEVETPMLVSNAGGASARPFETHFNALNEDLKLRISLELYLKRLIVGGMERVYEIGRVFRNEGLDTRHNPEFTLMELYQAYTVCAALRNYIEIETFYFGWNTIIICSYFNFCNFIRSHILKFLKNHSLLCWPHHLECIRISQGILRIHVIYNDGCDLITLKVNIYVCTPLVSIGFRVIASGYISLLIALTAASKCKKHYAS